MPALLPLITLLIAVLTPWHAVHAQSKTYETIEWETLLPEADLQAFMNPPDYLNDIVDGSAADQPVDRLKSDTIEPQNEWERALVSTNIVPEMDQRDVRIPGFVVPLEYNEDQQVTEFFLVPFFGACIHVPPPPPNQIIFMQTPEGMELESIYNAMWFSGTLRTSMTENAMATSAYSMVVDLAEPYSYEDF